MMNRTFCKAVPAGLLLAALTVNPAAAAGIEEVLVTAQRRTTDLQETAAAISAYGFSDLAGKGIHDVEDLGQFNPSMDVAIYQGEAQIYIRGIGTSGIVGGTDSSTAIHSNGVFLSRSAAAVPAFFDVERIEVIRGPQGTLYGRNATGGSVNIITKTPTETLSAEASALIGNYDRYRLSGAVSGPLIEDRLLGRLAFQREERDGYTSVFRPGTDPAGFGRIEDDIESKDDIAVRGTLEFRPSDNLTATLIGEYYRADDTNTIWLLLDEGTNTNPFMEAFVEAQGGFLPDPKTRRLGSDIEHFNKPEIWGITGKLEWAIGEYTLTSLSAYKETNPLNRDDLDLTLGFGTDQLREEDHWQFSQELQLSSPQGDRLEWLLGLYYFTEENDVRNEYFLPFVDEQFFPLFGGVPGDPDCCLLRLNGRSDTDAMAVFGEANYDVLTNVELVVGGRYSYERRDGANLVVFENFINTAFDNVAEFDEASFNSFTPKAGLNWYPRDGVFAYFSASRGFKSGGFNLGSYQNTPFEPELIWAYEAGAKLDLFADRLRINTAVFYYDYTDLQVQDVENNNVIIRNAATAEVLGVEMEGSALLNENWSFDFGFTWLDAEFTDLMLPDPKFPQLGIQDLRGNSLPRAPEWKFALGAQYTTPVDGLGDLTLRLDYAWQDKIYFSTFNVEQLSQGSYGWLKARASFTTLNDRWEVAVFMDNITDEAVMTNATFSGDIINSLAAGNMAPPRTFGMELSYRFN